MPLLVTFQGRVVKRRKRTSNGLRLYFHSTKPGLPGDQLVVSDADWLQHGQVRFLTAEQMTDLRAETPARTSSI